VRIQKHPIGFIKITLFSLFGIKARLHIWLIGRNKCRPDIHDHRWSFLSFPLFGRFEEKRFVSKRGSNYVFSLCYPESVNRKRKIIPHDEADISVNEKKIRWPMLPYSCKKGVIHSIVPLGKVIAASLIFCGRPRGEYSGLWRAKPDANCP